MLQDLQCHSQIQGHRCLHLHIYRQFRWDLQNLGQILLLCHLMCMSSNPSFESEAMFGGGHQLSKMSHFSPEIYNDSIYENQFLLQRHSLDIWRWFPQLLFRTIKVFTIGFNVIFLCVMSCTCTPFCLNQLSQQQLVWLCTQQSMNEST